jgi:hypothetical protein
MALGIVVRFADILFQLLQLWAPNPFVLNRDHCSGFREKPVVSQIRIELKESP